MARYIDADEVMQIINNYAKAIDYDCDNCKVVIDAIKDIVSVICPTADVEEVKHGEWKLVNRDLFPVHQCSLCGFGVMTDNLNFCANCGARMDESDE